jgi:hypothetical protein
VRHEGVKRMVVGFAGDGDDLILWERIQWAQGSGQGCASSTVRPTLGMADSDKRARAHDNNRR